MYHCLLVCVIICIYQCVRMVVIAEVPLLRRYRTTIAQIYFSILRKNVDRVIPSASAIFPSERSDGDLRPRSI